MMSPKREGHDTRGNWKFEWHHYWMPSWTLLPFQVLEKITQLVLKKINTEREEMETRSGARNEIERTTSPEDTMELMSAISYGLNLRPMSSANMPMPSPTLQNMGGNSRPGSGPAPGPPAKAVSAIKTNIKAATQVHPYQRNWVWEIN